MESPLGELYDRLDSEARKKAFFFLFTILEFYAAPDTWFAVALLKDFPCGDIARDYRSVDGSKCPGGRVPSWGGSSKYDLDHAEDPP